MHNAHESPLESIGEYPLGTSRILATILLMGHIAVAVTLVWVDIAVVFRMLIVAILLVSLVYELRSAALRLGAEAVMKLRIDRDNTLSVQLRSGVWYPCEVLGSTCVTSSLTVLNLRWGGRRRIRSVTILPDTMAADDYRRLRVWLRWRPAASRG